MDFLLDQGEGLVSSSSSSSSISSFDLQEDSFDMPSNDTSVQMYAIEECLDLYGGNLSSVPGNVKCLEHAPLLTQSTVIKSLILSVMAAFSLLGNVATMVSIHRSKRHKTAHVYTLIYHLSIADLFVTFWCILGDAIWSLTVEWKAGNVECKVFKFFQMLSLYLSTFIMVLIGVDRFIAVKYPLKSMGKGMCLKLIGVCWFFSAFFSLPQMVIFHVMKGPFVEDFYQCVTYGFYTAEWQEHLYTVFTLVCGFILPLFILAATYILTVVTLHRNEEILDHTGTFRTLIDPNRRKLLRRAKMKSLRISVAIVVTFLICWTPYYIIMITYLFFVPNKDQINEDLYSGFFFFGMSNSFFNPLIYGIFHIWTPRRKELQRRMSSRRTLLSFLSFHRTQPRSSGAFLNGSISNGTRNGAHPEAGMMDTTTTTTYGNNRRGSSAMSHHKSQPHTNNHHPPHHHHLTRGGTANSSGSSGGTTTTTTTSGPGISSSSFANGGSKVAYHRTSSTTSSTTSPHNHFHNNDLKNGRVINTSSSHSKSPIAPSPPPPAPPPASTPSPNPTLTVCICNNHHDHTHGSSLTENHV